MADNYDININVNENGADAAARRLEQLNNSANRAEGGIGGLGDAASNLGGPLGEAANAAQDLASKFASLQGVGAIGGFVVAALAAAVALEALAFNMSLAADDGAELEQKLGITAARMDQMTLIADENSGSVEGMVKVFDKLAKSLAKMDEDSPKVLDALANLGLRLEDLKDKSPEEQVRMIISAQEELGRSSESIAATSVLLGNGWRDQSVALKALAESGDEASARLDYFGVKVTENMLKKGAEAETAMTNLGLAWTGLKQQLADGPGNPFAEMTTGASEALRGIGLLLQAANQLTRERFEGKGILGRAAAFPGILMDIPGRAMTSIPEASNTALPVDSAAKKAAEDRVAATKKERADAAAGDEARRKAASSADAAAKQAEANAKRIAELGRAALQDGERQILVTQKQSHEEVARFDTSKGKLREITAEQKEQVIQLAKQRDIATDQQKRLDQRTEAEKKITDEIKQRVTSLQRLGDSASGRLEGVGTAMARSVSLEGRSVGLSSLDKQGLAATDNIASEAARGRAELNSALGNSTDVESLKAYQDELMKINESEKNATQVILDETEKRKVAQQDWSVGARNAIASYVDEANNLAGQMENLGTKMFKGMEDALVSFATTGKASFKDFARSIISDLARIAAQKAIAGLAGSLLGSIGGMFGPGVIGAGFANGGAFSKGTQFFADGGVVNRATGFGMAGGGQGVMGEAGPEAIMPLKRGADGKLGVAMSGGSSNPAISQTNIITVQGSSDGNPENDKKLAQLISNTIDKKWQENYAKATRVGGVANRVSLAV